MKLYTFPQGPNPRRVHIFTSEKGFDLDCEIVDILKQENRRPEFVENKNRFGGLPVLELDDGSTIAESVAICRYIEELAPSKPLFGEDAASKARVEMWVRRLELYFMMPVGMIWVHGSPFTKAVVKNQIPEAAKQNKALVKQFFKTFESALAGREFVCGETYTMADIIALTTFDFGVQMQLITRPEDQENIMAWYERVSSRPSAKAHLEIA